MSQGKLAAFKAAVCPDGLRLYSFLYFQQSDPAVRRSILRFLRFSKVPFSARL